MSHTIAAPEIIESPQNDNVLQGANTTLNCNATSEPTHSVIWSKNNMVINITDKYSISNSSFSRSLSSSLTIHNVDMGDTANYTCTVTNVHGNQTATAYIEIQGMCRKYTEIQVLVCLLLYHSTTCCSNESC